jgi:peptide chain release factor 3
MGRGLRGVYNFAEDRIYLYQPAARGRAGETKTIDGLQSEAARSAIGDELETFEEEVALVRGATHPFELAGYLAGRQTPVFFGSALTNFGVRELLDQFVIWAPPPRARESVSRTVDPLEPKLTGVVFKIQANMDKAHRDRVAFMRICSGQFERGMRLRHVRLDRELRVADAITFMAAERSQVDVAFAGDIIGLHNHGTINIGDTFTQGEDLQFTGIPNFAPELFKRVVLRDPLRLKALQKGLAQLSEEGATQFFRPLRSNELILGTVGPLQFDVVAYRLKTEYSVDCTFEPVQVATARWVSCKDSRRLEEFRRKSESHLALDHGASLVYIAPNRVNLDLTIERWPEIEFHETRDRAA